MSNSDAVPGQDPTNPVTFCFGMNYAFPRTIVSMDEHGHFTYTPTIDYGGNNGRSALLAPNGLYYAVGNANNGNATAFGPGNGTNPDVTETTGLEVVNPLNEFWPSRSIPAGNSAEVDPLLQFTCADPNKVVRITDRLAATSFTGSVAEESFVAIAGPTYGNVMWFEWKARASSQIFSRRADTRRPAAARSLWSQ